jgi:hypothetical protein
MCIIRFGSVCENGPFTFNSSALSDSLCHFEMGTEAIVK